MQLTLRAAAITFAAAFFLIQPEASGLNLKKLEPAEEAVRASLLQALEPVIAPKKKDGTAVLLAWEALYAPLHSEQRAFLDSFRRLRSKDLGGSAEYHGDKIPGNLAPVGPQTLMKEGVATPVDPQYLPRPALEAYERMMAAMRVDTGKQLLIESGYRSPAYQLYLFIYYMSNHELSIQETNRHVALPGHSEHGAPQTQAIDFINEEGINGEYNPPEFEALPEYAWLQAHAASFGFVLSFPRDNKTNTAFEPWHWRYEAARDTQKPQA